jgi:hypothetical protein
MAGQTEVSANGDQGPKDSEIEPRASEGLPVRKRG